MAGKPRSTLYTPALADALVEWISIGKTLRAFCRRAGAPHWTTVYDWIAADEAFALRIARARELGADAIAEDALKIADTPKKGTTITVDKDGTKCVTEDMLGHRKLQVDTRLKLLAKWQPKKYGEHLDLTHKGDAAHPLVISQTDAKL